MLHYYRVLYTTYNNGVKVGNTSGFTIADESEVKEETIPITWEKNSRNSKTVYKVKSTGKDLVVNDGNTFIEIGF